MSSVDPHRPGLSEQLKFLDSAQGQLAPPPFDLDDVVRGGRRRHRRRTALQASGVAAAVIAVVAGVTLGPLSRGGTEGIGPAQVAGSPTATASATPTLPPIDASAVDLDYTRTGETVTASLDGKIVATLTFDSWTWSGSAGSVVIRVTATRPFAIDPMTFNLAADDSNENSPSNEETVTVGVETRDVTLNFEGFRSPAALLWVPQEPKWDEDDGVAIDWELTAANRK